MLDHELRGDSKYEEVTLGTGGTNFAPKSSILGPRFQMTVFLLAGTLLMFAHHFFYAYLNGKPVDSHLWSIHGFTMRKQSFASIVGNSIAYVARTVLSTGIGIVFIQVLWSKLRRGGFSVEQIDALVVCKGGPFAPSALPTWHYAFWLAIIAAMSTLMALISIVAPGSLQIESLEFSFPTACTVQTVSLETSNIGSYCNITAGNSSFGIKFEGAPARLTRLATQVLIGGAPLQLANPCPATTACQYVIKFNAPVASCTPFDSSDNMTWWLPSPSDDSPFIRVWTGGIKTEGGLWIGAAARDLNQTSQAGAGCIINNATYHVLITHTNTSTSTVDVLKTDINNQFDSMINDTVADSISQPEQKKDYIVMQYDAVIAAFADAVVGPVNYRADLKVFSGDGNYAIAYSPLFEGSSDDSWVWDSGQNLSAILSSYMQNLSVSLLSDQFSKEGNSTASHETTCWYSSTTYEYDEVRLLATYSAALLITAICMLFGLRAIRMNGAEESVSFSRILGAILNTSLFEDRFKLSDSSRLTANGNVNGQLTLVHATYGQG